MRIAIFTDSFLPLIDGVVTVTISLAEHLAERGHHVYIIAPRYKNITEYRHKNVTVKRISSFPAFFYKGFRFSLVPDVRIIRYLKKERVDIIHFQTPVTLGLQAVITARILKLPLVGTYHTMISDKQYMRHVGLDSRFAQRLTWKYARMFYDRCDLVTCPTRIIKKELRQHGFKRPIAAISNGIDIARFDTPQWKKVKQKYNKDGKLLLYTGRIAYEKNIPYLLDCVALIRKEMPSVKLLMVGDGPQMAEVKAHIRKRHLTDAVILTGSIEHERLMRSGIFKACDVLVTASTTETQSITILEAQANGLPAVAIRERGVTEVIRDKYDGFLVRNNDKKAFARSVVALLRNDALRKRMSENALQDVRRHDIKLITHIWERKYQQLINRRKK